MYKKYFGRYKVIALRAVSLDIFPNKSLGIVGPNGAGKTTLLRIMAGVLIPTSGTIQRNNSVKIGYIPDPPPFYEKLSVYDNLFYFAKIDNLPNPKKSVKTALKKVGLERWENLTPAELSNGMRRRLAIARALLRNTKFLIMDEPFSGLDPDGAIDIKKILKNLKNSGVSFVLSSHNLTYVEELCDEVIFIKNGILIKNNDKNDENKGDLIIYCKYPSHAIPQEAIPISKGLKFENVYKEDIPYIIKNLVEKNTKIYEVIFKHISLEDKYHKIMKGGD